MVTGVLVRASDVRPERVRWIWRNRVPRGKITFIDGDPGVGKSTAAVDLVARLTTGRPMPETDAAELPASNVLYLSLEDGLADTVVPRLIAARADLTRVHFWTHELDLGPDGETYEERDIGFPSDTERLRERITETDARLVVVDVLTGYLDGKVDSYKDQDSRTVTRRLKRLAEELDVAILAIRHLTKKRDGKATNAGGGSIGWAGAARSVLTVGRDPDDPERSVLAVAKLNVGRTPAALAYRLVPADPTDPDGPARVAWEGPVEVTADDLVAIQTGDRQTETDRAVDLVRDLLGDGPRPARECESAADSHGVSRSALKRAKGRLGVRSVKDGLGGWIWQATTGSGSDLLVPSSTDAESPGMNARRDQESTHSDDLTRSESSSDPRRFTA